MKLPILFLVALSACLAADEPGFAPIFNGKDLTNWTIRGQYGPGYVVENGMIVCPADGGGNLFTIKEYSNFILRFEFRLEEASNNGIGIRAPCEGYASYKCQTDSDSGWEPPFSETEASSDLPTFPVAKTSRTQPPRYLARF